MVKLRFIILIDFVKTYGYLPSTIGQYPPTRNSIERQSSLVSPEGMVPQERMYLSQFRWLGQPFPLLFLLTLAKKKKKKKKQTIGSTWGSIEPVYGCSASSVINCPSFID